MVMAMLSIQQLSGKIEALNKQRLSLEDFEDWFASESWGNYDIAGDELSNAISAVRHALYSYETGEFDEDLAVEELAAAIAPFANPFVSIVSAQQYAVDNPNKPIASDFWILKYLSETADDPVLDAVLDTGIASSKPAAHEGQSSTWNRPAKRQTVAA